MECQGGKKQWNADVENAIVHSIGETILVVETGASDHAITASLNQIGRPGAFLSRASVQKHSTIEKGGIYHSGDITLLNDQKSVMIIIILLVCLKISKIKKDNIQR